MCYCFVLLLVSLISSSSQLCVLSGALSNSEEPFAYICFLVCFAYFKFGKHEVLFVLTCAHCACSYVLLYSSCTLPVTYLS